MRRFLVALFFTASVALAQYKAEPAGAPPSELPAPFASLLEKTGAKIVGPGGSVFCELWFRTEAPSGSKSTEEGVTLPAIPHGAFMGVIRFPGRGSDRRGQNIKPGVYTLRYSLQPVNGDHLGVAPQRDFLVLVPAAEDKDPKSTPGFDDLMAMSKKASGTPHPAVLSISSSSGDKSPILAKEGDNDWVLKTKIGNLSVALIVVGKAEG
jgi:hypothetical protein